LLAAGSLRIERAGPNRCRRSVPASGRLHDRQPVHLLLIVAARRLILDADKLNDRPRKRLVYYKPPGFADTATAQCGEPWTTRPGNSSKPPATVTGTVPMVVSSTITKSGPVISGDTTEVVLVQVEPGYEPNPGHPGTGTVVGIVCQEGGPVPT
jgi:hypothetical protein